MAVAPARCVGASAAFDPVHLSAKTARRVCAPDRRVITARHYTRAPLYALIRSRVISLRTIPRQRTRLVVLDPAEPRILIWNRRDPILPFAIRLESSRNAGLWPRSQGWGISGSAMAQMGEEFLGRHRSACNLHERAPEVPFPCATPKTGPHRRFVTVANRTTADDGAYILAGNEKVLSHVCRRPNSFFGKRPAHRQSMPGCNRLTACPSDLHNKAGTQAELILRIGGTGPRARPMVGADADEYPARRTFAKGRSVRRMVLMNSPDSQGLWRYTESRPQIRSSRPGPPKTNLRRWPIHDVPTATGVIAVRCRQN